MKRTFLLLFSLFSLVSLQAENKVSLTLIPPGKITNKVDLDIRGGIVNESASQQTYQVALYWNKENKDALLYETVVTIPAGKAETVKVVIPTKDRVGKNKVIFKVANEGKAYRKTKDIEVIESDIRSIQQISGAWTGIYHWSEIEGKHWNQDIKKMTDDQWRELIRSMNKLEMNMVVIQEVFRNEEYVGKHTTNVDNYVGKAFYPSKLYPGRMELTAKDPIEAILTEANQEFEQSPLIEQLFLVYYRVADDEEEGEWILAADILQRIQKASKMKFSSGQVNYFGRILQRLGVKSYRKTRGVYYHVVAVAQKEIQGNCERLAGRKTL